jgi:hypothetical protein
MCGTFDFEKDRYQCKIDCRKEQHARTSTPTTSTAPPRIPLLSPIINPAPTAEHLKTSTPAATTTTKERNKESNNNKLLSKVWTARSLAKFK